MTDLLYVKGRDIESHPGQPSQQKNPFAVALFLEGMGFFGASLPEDGAPKRLLLCVQRSFLATQQICCKAHAGDLARTSHLGLEVAVLQHTMNVRPILTVMVSSYRLAANIPSSSG